MARQPLKWKKSTLAAAAAIALCLAATGTLAALTARSGADRAAGEAAPGVNLHDDFAGGPEKHVYAENSGGTAMLPRIRFTELLQLSNGDLLPILAVDDAAGTGWRRHIPAGDSLTDCGFEAHQTFSWTLGGQKAYMPAAQSALAQGDYTDEKNYIPPMDVGDTLSVIDYIPLLRKAFEAQENTAALARLDAWRNGDDTVAQPLQKDIAALPDSLIVSGVLQYGGQPEDEQTRRLNEIRLTAITTRIITMQEWLESGRTLGNFWVMDSDGWCYWASSLSKGQATGLLMQSCTYTEERSTDVVYKIRAELDATTTLPDDINRYLTENDALGDITPAAMELTIMASGSYVYGADGELYIPNTDNTLIHVVKNGDSYANYILGDRTCAGADEIAGTEDDLRPGQGIAVHRDGSLYHITAPDWTPPDSWAGPYEILGIASGENGTAYLELNNRGYCCSVQSVTPGDEGYLKPAALGLGPFRLVWPGEDGAIGTDDDLYNDNFAAVGTSTSAKFYRRLSEKVYIRVAALGDAEPALYLSQDGLYYLDREGGYVNEADLSPLESKAGESYAGPAAPLYYAAGKEYGALETSTFALEAMTGTAAAAPDPLTYNCLGSYSFRFLLGTRFKFTQGGGYLFPSDAGYAGSALTEYELTPTGVVRGGDGRFYLRTEVNGENPTLRWYIGPGGDDILGTADDVRTKAGADLLIGTEDDSADFTPVNRPAPLDFLPVNFTGAVGDTFTVDGSGWVVLSRDGANNLLIAATDSNFGSAVFNPSQADGANYEGSNLQEYYQSSVTPRLECLLPYLRPASIPVSGLSAYDPAGVRTAFPLSDADVRAHSALLNDTWLPVAARAYSLRSPSTSAGYPAENGYMNAVGSSGDVYAWDVTDALLCRPALIVNFGTLKLNLPYDFTGLPGERLYADGYNWVVLDRDAAGNSMLMTMEWPEEMGARGTQSGNGLLAPAYKDTLWVTEGRDAAFTQKLTALLPYARAAGIPDEPEYPYKAPWDTITGGLSTCTGSADNAVAFVISAGEYNTYLYSAPGMEKYVKTGVFWALRSRYGAEGAPSANPGYATTVNGNGAPYDAYPNTKAYLPRMALWVNFGLSS